MRLQAAVNEAKADADHVRDMMKQLLRASDDLQDKASLAVSASSAESVAFAKEKSVLAREKQQLEIQMHAAVDDLQVGCVSPTPLCVAVHSLLH